MLTLDKFEEASEKVKEVTTETKLVYSDYFSQQTGNKVYLKPENMQFTGAYKVRGAYYKISTLTEEERAKGLITASAGNHAQGVAYAAKCYGCKAVIVMATTTPPIKGNRRATAQRLCFTEMCMMRHARRLTNSQRKRDTHLFIHLMISQLQPVRVRSQWKSSKSFRW